jgi:glutaredoxin
MPKVKIYSTGWCAYCKAEKQFLTEQKVEFEEVNVEEDAVAAKEMVDLSHQMGVPVTRITHEDNTVAFQVGFDQDWLAEQLKLTIA